MRRSEINRAIEWAEALLARDGVRLPRYAHWDMDKWAENKEQIEEIRRAGLGWYVTGAGGGLAVVYTARNGGPGAPCRERYILMREDMGMIPLRRAGGARDIVNRGRGVMAARLWNIDAAGNRLEAPVHAWQDGMARSFGAGERLRVYPGDSISVGPGMDCEIGPEPGYGDLIACELGACGGELFPAAEIEEDEAVLRPLCDEYAKLI